MKSYRKLRSKKNKTRNKRRRGGSAASNNKITKEESLRIDSYIIIRTYLKIIYNYSPDPAIEKILLLRIPSLTAKLINKGSLFADRKVNTIQQKEKLFINYMFPNLSIVKKILEIMNSDPKFSQAELISGSKLFELSLELEKYPLFIDEYNRIPEDELTIDSVLTILDRHDLTAKFVLTS